MRSDVIKKGAPAAPNRSLGTGVQSNTFFK